MFESADVAYCGLVCGKVCIHACNGCLGCRKGGGSEGCHKRQCCRDHGFDGCWQCDSFPCAAGFFDDEAWHGLTVGCIRMIREMGAAAFVSMVVTRLGEGFDYGYLRYRAPEQIQAILRGEVEVPRDDPEER